MSLKRLGGEPPKKKKSVAKKARVVEPEQSGQTPSAPAPIEQTTITASPPPRTQGQVRLSAPNEESPGDQAFDMNAPYRKNIPMVDKSVIPQVLAKRM